MGAQKKDFFSLIIKNMAMLTDFSELKFDYG